MLSLPSNHFTYLARANINTVGTDVTVPSALQHAVVYSHTGLAVPGPARVALAGGGAGARTGAQGLQEKGDKKNYMQQKKGGSRCEYSNKSPSSDCGEFLNDQLLTAALGVEASPEKS